MIDTFDQRLCPSNTYQLVIPRGKVFCHTRKYKYSYVQKNLYIISVNMKSWYVHWLIFTVISREVKYIDIKCFGLFYKLLHIPLSIRHQKYRFSLESYFARLEA